MAQYCDRKTLQAEIIKSQARGRVNNEVGKAIMKIAEGMGKKGNWFGYSYRDEMVATAIVQMSDAVVKFDPAKSDNPFGYLSMVAHNSFLRVLKSEKKQADIK